MLKQKKYKHNIGDLVFLMPYGLGYVESIKKQNRVYPYIIHWLESGAEYKMSDDMVKHHKDILKRYLEMKYGA